jgi:hypothetical protein
MNHFSVIVGITIKGFSVPRVAEAIGLEGDPDAPQRRAERNGPNTNVRRKASAEVWTLTAKRGRTIEARVQSLLADLPSDLPVKLKALRGAKGCMSIAVMCFDKVATLQLSKRLISAIANFGLGLEVKVFSPTERR